MARQPYLKRGTWTRAEDQKLIAYITRYGIWNWNQMPKFAGLQRSGKSCRLRWMNYLKPDIRRGNFTREEEDTIIQLQKMLGNRWSAIAARLPQRTDNDIKNYWNTCLKKRLLLENNNSASSIPETNISCIIQPEQENSCGVDSFVSSTENSSASASVSPTEIVSAIGFEPEQENSSEVVDSTIFLNDFPGLEPAACTAFSPSDSGSNCTVGVNDNHTMNDNLVSSENLNYWEIESLWEQPLMTMEGLDCKAFAPNSQLWHIHHDEHYDPVNDFWVNPLI